MKRCNKCHKEKPLREFSGDSSCRRGVKNQCKDCISEISKARYKAILADPKKCAQYKLARYEAEQGRRRSRSQQRAHAAVARAMKSGELRQLDGSVACVDCGDPATQYDHRYYSKPLDVEPVCQRCNSRRGPALDARTDDKKSFRGAVRPDLFGESLQY